MPDLSIVHWKHITLQIPDASEVDLISYSMYNFHLCYCFSWHQTAAVKESYLNTWMFEWYPQPCGELPNVYAALNAATIVCKGGIDKEN